MIEFAFEPSTAPNFHPGHCPECDDRLWTMYILWADEAIHCPCGRILELKEDDIYRVLEEMWVSQ